MKGMDKEGEKEEGGEGGMEGESHRRKRRGVKRKAGGIFI